MTGKIKANINSKIDFYKSVNRNYLHNIIIFLLYLYVSFSTSYQVFKDSQLELSKDSKSYMQMSNGNYNVNSTHRYRFIIPKTVSLLRPYLGNVYKSNSVMDETKTKKKQERLVNQSLDLAKLSQSLLKGEELSTFIKRSFDMIK